MKKPSKSTETIEYLVHFSKADTDAIRNVFKSTMAMTNFAKDGTLCVCIKAPEFATIAQIAVRLTGLLLPSK